MKKCTLNLDGYCQRPENDYCPADKCSGVDPTAPEFGIPLPCTHPMTVIQVLNQNLNCETTVEVCANPNCAKWLSTPYTDCR